MGSAQRPPKAASAIETPGYCGSLSPAQSQRQAAPERATAREFTVQQTGSPRTWAGPCMLVSGMAQRDASTTNRKLEQATWQILAE